MLLPALLRRRLAPALFACMLASPAAAGLQFEPYPLETEAHGTIDAEVAFFDVPRRHAEPGGPRMRLRVVRLRAHAQPARNAPIVYLAGGPGGSGVGTARGARWPVFDAVRGHADVLLFDQRGTGLSEPPPPCPHRAEFPDDRAGTPDAMLAALQAAVRRCVDGWRAAGVDLDAYNTVDSAHDVDALRRALGIERISLWGMSYGTHLALAVLRLHGDGVERTVLMGTEGPDDTLKLPLEADALLQRLADRMRGQAAATAVNPDLVGSVRRVLATLERQPAIGRIRRPLQDDRTVVLGMFDAQLVLAGALGRTSTARLLPLAFADAERGEFDLLAELTLAVREQLAQPGAMALATDLASGASAARHSTVLMQQRESLLGPALNFPFPAIGEGLGITVLGDDFRAPVRTHVPALFVVGTLDGRTPPANTDAVSRGFANAHRLTLDGAGHDDELWLGDPRIAASIGAFFAGDEMHDATLAMPPIAFATSIADELRAAALARLRPLVPALFAACAVLGIAAAWFVHRRRARRRAQAAAHAPA